MMTFYDINKIPSLVASGKMTREEGARTIGDVVRSNPASFGLAHLNVLIRNNVINRVAQNGENILNVFDERGDPLLSQLTIYIHFLIRLNKKLFLDGQRQKAREELFDDDRKEFPHLRGNHAVLHERCARRRRTLSHHRSCTLAFV